MEDGQVPGGGAGLDLGHVIEELEDEVALEVALHDGLDPETEKIVKRSVWKGKRIATGSDGDFRTSKRNS